jgi:hypothetical protein
MSESGSVKSVEAWSSLDWENELAPLLPQSPLPPPLLSTYSHAAPLLAPPTSQLDGPGPGGTSDSECAAGMGGDIGVASARDTTRARDAVGTAGAWTKSTVAVGERGAVIESCSAGAANGAASDAASKAASATGKADAASDEIAGTVPASQGPIVLLELGDASSWKEWPRRRK